MADNQNKLEQASQILERFRVAQIFSELVESSYAYESTKHTTFATKRDIDGLENLDSAIRISRDNNQIVLAFGKFSPTYSPDGEDTALRADAYIYFNTALVLHTRAAKEYDQYGHATRVSTYSSSLELFKAGPWLEILGECFDDLEARRSQRTEQYAAAALEQQASNIELGSYAVKPIGDTSSQPDAGLSIWRRPLSWQMSLVVIVLTYAGIALFAHLMEQ